MRAEDGEDEQVLQDGSGDKRGVDSEKVINEVGAAIVSSRLECGLPVLRVEGGLRVEKAT